MPARACSARVDLVPDRRGVDGGVVHARVQCDLGGATRDPRIARALRQIDVGLRRQSHVAALARDLGEKVLVEQVLRELLIRIGRAVLGLGPGGLNVAADRIVALFLSLLGRRARLGRIRRAGREHGKRHRGQEARDAEIGRQGERELGHGSACCSGELV